MTVITAAASATGAALDRVEAEALAVLLFAVKFRIGLMWDTGDDIDCVDARGLVDSAGEPWPDRGADVRGAYVTLESGTDPCRAGERGPVVQARVPVARLVAEIAAARMWAVPVAERG